MKNISKKDIILIVSIFLILSAIGFYFIKKEKLNDTTIFKTEQTFNNDENINTYKELVIDIVGEVKKPGIVKLREGDRVIDAIEKAGGTTDRANLDEINLAYKLTDGQQIVIPKKEEIKVNIVPSQKKYSKSSSSTSKISIPSKYISSSVGKAIVSNSLTLKETDPNGEIININTASALELDKLPGVGEVTAKKIIDYRQKNGTFKVIEDIMKVGGIGKSKFEQIKGKITV